MSGEEVTDPVDSDPAVNEWNATPPIPGSPSHAVLVGIYQNHRRVGTAVFVTEASAEAFHAFVNAGEAALTDGGAARLDSAPDPECAGPHTVWRIDPDGTETDITDESETT